MAAVWREEWGINNYFAKKKKDSKVWWVGGSRPILNEDHNIILLLFLQLLELQYLSLSI